MSASKRVKLSVQTTKGGTGPPGSQTNPISLEDRLSKGVFPFLKLAGELKNAVYVKALDLDTPAVLSIGAKEGHGLEEYYDVSGSVINKPSHPAFEVITLSGDFRPNTELIRVCKEVCEQTTSMIYANSFVFLERGNWSNMRAFLSVIGSAIHHLRSISIHKISEHRALHQLIGLEHKESMLAALKMLTRVPETCKVTVVGKHFDCGFVENLGEPDCPEFLPEDYEECNWLCSVAKPAVQKALRNTKNEDLRKFFKGTFKDIEITVREMEAVFEEGGGAMDWRIC